MSIHRRIGLVIGMAYVSVSQSDVGHTFYVAVDDGEKVLCTVVDLPFYDAESLRQGM